MIQIAPPKNLPITKFIEPVKIINSTPSEPEEPAESTISPPVSPLPPTLSEVSDTALYAENSEEIARIINDCQPKTKKPRATYTICTNPELEEQLIPMINKAYEETEKDMWSRQVIRCDFLPKSINQMIVDREMILAYVENELAGCVYFNINEETKFCYFSLLAVKEDFRGYGIGTKLVDHVEFLAKERGALAVECDTLTLAEHDESETENFELTKKFVAGWYVKLGYRIVEVLPTETHDKFLPMRPMFQRPMWSLKYRKEVSYLM